MGTDNTGAIYPLVEGNNVHIVLNVDSREELDSIFKAPSENGKVVMEHDVKG